MEQDGTRLRAVLFADLVSSTDHRRRLGDDRADDVFSSMISLMEDAVRQGSGVVVKSLGDGIMAVFDGATDAIRSAAEMQLAAAARSHGSELPMEITVGLSAGDVAWRDSDVQGMPVVEAARLCDLASAGQVLSSGLVQMLSGSRSPVEFSSTGSHQLKGIGDVEVWEVLWQQLAQSVGPAGLLPLPDPLAWSTVGLVGRSAILAELRASQRRADTGGVWVDVLIGEAGIGKTAAVTEHAQSTHGDGGAVLFGRCDDEVRAPYRPFVEALRHFIAGTSRGLVDALGPGASYLSSLAPELASLGVEPPPPSDPDTQRFRLFEAVTDWLAGVGGDEPVTLVLDDLQWADHDSLLLLRHIVRSNPGCGFSIVCTVRDTDVESGDTFAVKLGELRRETNVRVHRVDGIDLDAITAIVRQLFSAERVSDAAAVAAVVEQLTEGNPFFVTEALRSVATAADVDAAVRGLAAGGGDAEGALLRGIDGVVSRRLELIDQHQLEVLRLAAVIGLEFDLPMLVEASADDLDAVGAALDAAVGATLLRQIGRRPLRYRFEHALVRVALQAQLGAFELALAHWNVGQAIERIHAADLVSQSAALATHYYRSLDAVDEVNKAIEYAMTAGHVARKGAAPTEALHWFSVALELMDSGDSNQRCRAMFRFGQAQLYAGVADWPVTLNDAAEMAGRLEDGALMVTILLVSGRMGVTSYETPNPRRRGLVEQALDLIPESDERRRALMLATLSGDTMLDRPEQSVSAALEAIRLADDLSTDPVTQASVFSWCATSLIGPNMLPTRAKCLAELERLEQLLSVPWMSLSFASARSTYLVQIGDIAGLRRQNEAIRDDVIARTLPTMSWIHALYDADLEVADGNLDAAIEGCERARSFMVELGEPDADYVATSFRSLFMFYAGRFEEAAPLLSPLAAKPGTFGVAKAAWLAAIGAPIESVVAQWASATRWFFDAPIVDAIRASGNADAARTVSDRLTDDVGDYLLTMGAISMSKAWALGVLAGVCASVEEADEYFATAEALEVGRCAEPLLARVRVDWAHVLCAHDPERAGALVELALPVTERLGIADLRRRLVQLAGRLDVPEA